MVLDDLGANQYRRTGNWFCIDRYIRLCSILVDTFVACWYKFYIELFIFENNYTLNRVNLGQSVAKLNLYI